MRLLDAACQLRQHPQTVDCKSSHRSLLHGRMHKPLCSAASPLHRERLLHDRSAAALLECSTPVQVQV